MLQDSAPAPAPTGGMGDTLDTSLGNGTDGGALQDDDAVLKAAFSSNLFDANVVRPETAPLLRSFGLLRTTRQRQSETEGNRQGQGCGGSCQR